MAGTDNRCPCFTVHGSENLREWAYKADMRDLWERGMGNALHGHFLNHIEVNRLAQRGREGMVEFLSSEITMQIWVYWSICASMLFAGWVKGKRQR